MKRVLVWLCFTAVMAGIGAVGGVVYPYTELIFSSDLDRRQRDRHTDTLMHDDGERARRRAWLGAGYMTGMTALVLVVRVGRRSSKDQR